MNEFCCEKRAPGQAEPSQVEPSGIAEAWWNAIKVSIPNGSSVALNENENKSKSGVENVDDV